ncbi:MAG: tetratricopeptide repeat protein [Bacteroidota bacterium]
MSTDQLQSELRKGNFPAATDIFSRLQHQMSIGEKHLWQTRIGYQRGEYRTTFKNLEAYLANTKQTVTGDDEIQAFCYIYYSLLVQVVQPPPEIDLSPLITFVESLVNASPLVLGFGWETIGRLQFVCIASHQTGKESAPRGIASLKKALRHYAASPDSFLYHDCALLLTEQLHKYETNFNTQKELNRLRETFIGSPLVQVLECKLILLRIRLQLTTDSTERERLLELCQQIPYPLGLGRFQLEQADAAFEQGQDGRQWIEKAITIFTTFNSSKYALEAWRAYSLQSLHFSHLREAIRGYKQALELAQNTGDVHTTIIVRMGIAETFHRMGEFGEAVAHYEAAQELMQNSPYLPFIGLNLANVYDQMNLSKKGIDLALRVVQQLEEKKYAPEQLSSAYFIMGNLLTSTKQWEAAIATWQKAIKYDEEHKYFKGQAEKTISLVWTFAQAKYQEDKIIRAETVAEFSNYYDLALALLRKQTGKQELIVAEGQIYQNFANIHTMAQQYPESLAELDKALQLYQMHHLHMQAANTFVMKGLLAFELGKSIDAKYWEVATDTFHEALDFIRQEQLQTFAWRIYYYLAIIAANRGILSRDTKQQADYYAKAEEYLQSSHEAVQQMRQAFFYQQITMADEGKLALIADKGKVYQFGINLNLRYTYRPARAFQWLERYKSQSLLDNLREQLKKKSSRIGRLSYDYESDNLFQFLQKILW